MELGVSLNFKLSKYPARTVKTKGALGKSGLIWVKQMTGEPVLISKLREYFNNH